MKIQQHDHPGRPRKCTQEACILFYTNSTCIFCPIARQMLEERLQEHSLPMNAIHEVDCDSINAARNVTALPTIQICGQTIVGIPESDRLDTALWKLRVTPCFQIIR